MVDLVDEPRLAPPLVGLSAEEAARRAARGLGNAVAGREVTFAQTLRRNTLSFFNVVLAGLVVVLLALAVVDRNIGHAQDGLFVSFVAIANIAVATLQEFRATRTLQRLSALTAPQAAVIRDGHENPIAADAVVQGDLIHLRRGDQVVADGRIVAQAVEVDESLLTGEAKSAPKGPGDELLSGSFATAGDCYYGAERVGAEAYAHRLAADARTLVRRQTPLQLRFQRILRVLLTATAALGVLLMIAYNVGDRGFAEAVKATTATLTTVVPEGLLLSLTVAFAVGAARVSRHGAVVQDIAAIEALNYVDVVCLDKTGTITANKLSLREVQWVPVAEDAAPWLGAYAAATAGESRTAAGIAAALAATANDAAPGEGVPFSSERRWGARQLLREGETRTFLLGAPEALLPTGAGADSLREANARATAAGLRSVVFAEADGLPGADGALPALRPLALLTLADVLRPEVTAAFATMARLGIEPKLISGDSPDTVAALVAQLGIRLKGGALSGADLSRLDDNAFAAAIEGVSIFGRIAPDQKARIVAALRRNGHFVAMVGDGANDVQALRAADVAVAMASGTAIARAVAGIVLLDDSFAAFVAGTKEAQAVLGNAARLSKLFLAKSLYAFLIIVATNMLALNFPFLPRHGSVTALLTLGIPAVFISASVPPRDAGRDFTRNVLRFALPAAFALASAAIVVHLLTEGFLDRTVEEARTLVSLTVGITGLFYMLEVLGFAGASLRNPLRPVLSTLLGAALLGGLLLTLYTPWLRRFFDFTEVGPGQWLIVLPAVAAALAGQYALAHYWPRIIDVLIAKPPAAEAPRGRAV